MYSNFFHGKNVSEKITCKTRISRFDRKFLDYKMGLPQEEIIFLRQSRFAAIKNAVRRWFRAALCFLYAFKMCNSFMSA